ncbi:hypothetical protein A1O3_00873 [Capronia epimyces CBS 606.96]|uniref:Uncharacterized protein n=1 Tax=Capronia epimyces CBS 606.96 TaxID=1182542 RepID=W9YIG2_9EURO|nr:uncharacterized protein A1O3_00873 [Capronia epimyces CBS 606.96]EXJ92323.1 hypothetical protein A1O3_00873 [Capronia epimyces CBS 606.96]
MATVYNTVSTSPLVGTDDGHQSLQQTVLRCRQSGETPECECHSTHYSESDIRRSIFSVDSRDLLKSVKSFPFVVEKSLTGVGEIRLELWNTSARSLSSCHLRLIVRLERVQVKSEDGEYPDPLLEVLEAALSDTDGEAIKAQLYKGAAGSCDDAVELLYDVIFHLLGDKP